MSPDLRCMGRPSGPPKASWADCTPLTRGQGASIRVSEMRPRTPTHTCNLVAWSSASPLADHTHQGVDGSMCSTHWTCVTLLASRGDPSSIAGSSSKIDLLTSWRLGRGWPCGERDVRAYIQCSRCFQAHALHPSNARLQFKLVTAELTRLASVSTLVDDNSQR